MFYYYPRKDTTRYMTKENLACQFGEVTYSSIFFSVLKLLLNILPLKFQCAAGRAAWQEAAALSVGGGGGGAGGAARRCSVLGDHPGARRDPRAKWHRNNRVWNFIHHSVLDR